MEDNAMKSIKKVTVMLLALFLAAVYPASAQSKKTVCSTCSFLVPIAPPQLLLQKAFTQAEVELLFQLAVRDGHILEDGTVSNRTALAELALSLLRQKELSLTFDSKAPNGAALVGYIQEMESGNALHYALTGTNRDIVYNPCEAPGATQTFLGVYVVAR